MKSHFKHLLLTIVAAFSLTACSDLLSMMPRRQSNGSDSAHASSSEVNQDDAPNYQVLCDGHDEYEPITTYVNVEITASFYLWDSDFGAKVKLSDESYVVAPDTKLALGYANRFSSVDAEIMSSTTGNYPVEAVLISSEGFRYERTFTVVVDPGQKCTVEIYGNTEMYLNTDNEINVQIYDKAENRYVPFHRANPLYEYTCGPEIDFVSLSLIDQYTLKLVFRGVMVGSDVIHLCVQTNTEETYDGFFNYHVENKINQNTLVCEMDPIIVETYSSQAFCFYIYDENHNRVNMQTDFWDITISNSDFTYDLVEIQSDHIKIQFNNVNAAGGSTDFVLRVKDKYGYEVTGYFTVYSRSYYENALSMDLNVTAVSNGFYKLSIQVFHMDGTVVEIKAVHYKARKDIVCDEYYEENLSVDKFEHTFALKEHGDDVIDVDVGTAEGTWLASGIYVSL